MPRRGSTAVCLSRLNSTGRRMRRPGLGCPGSTGRVPRPCRGRTWHVCLRNIVIGAPEFSSPPGCRARLRSRPVPGRGTRSTAGSIRLPRRDCLFRLRRPASAPDYVFMCPGRWLITTCPVSSSQVKYARRQCFGSRVFALFFRWRSSISLRPLHSMQKSSRALPWRAGADAGRFLPPQPAQFVLEDIAQRLAAFLLHRTRRGVDRTSFSPDRHAGCIRGRCGGAPDVSPSRCAPVRPHPVGNVRPLPLSPTVLRAAKRRGWP